MKSDANALRRPDCEIMKPRNIIQARRAIQRTRNWVVAFEVTKHRDDVCAFRERWLPNGLLPRSGAALRRWVKEFRPSDHGVSGSGPLLAQPPKTMSICTPQPGGWLEPEAYDFSDIPDIAKSLGDLSTKLASEYGWIESSAASWLLMEGVTPESIRIDVYATRGDMKRVEPRTDNVRDIQHLNIHVVAPLDTPSTLILREVQALQNRFKKNYVYDLPARTREYDGDTHESLPFALERNDGRSWLEVLEEWNAAHPESKFETTTEGAAAFGKNIRRAYEQIMGRKLDWKRRPGSAAGGPS